MICIGLFWRGCETRITCITPPATPLMKNNENQTCGLLEKLPATERAKAGKLPVLFEVCDATKRTFPEASFDVIYSKGALMHIPDKLALMKGFHPGGQLLLSDYCCGEKPWTPVFEAYVKHRGCSLCTSAQYGQLIQEAGFCNVRAEDRTAQFISLVKAELQRAEATKDEFIEELSEEEYGAMVNRWKEKFECSNSGDHQWGLFHATKN